MAHSHSHAFTRCLWLLCLQTVEAEELQQKSYGLKNLTPHDLGLHRNSLPPPVVKGSAVMPPSLSWILSPGNPVVSSCQLVIPPGARGTRRRRQEESCLSRAGLLPSPSPTSAVTRALLCDTINSDKAETVPPRISKQKLFLFPTKTVTKSLVKSRFP